MPEAVPNPDFLEKFFAKIFGALKTVALCVFFMHELKIWCSMHVCVLCIN